MTSCFCDSGLEFDACCGPVLAGAAPADAKALMRARFSAFVLSTKKATSPADKERLATSIAFLQRTLHSSQPEAKFPMAKFRALLEKNARRARYHAMNILDTDGPDAQGVHRVLFRVRMWNAGKDTSFVELSSFSREGDALRYVAGALVPAKAFDELGIKTIPEVLASMESPPG